jgi:hypothetical protein
VSQEKKVFWMLSAAYMVGLIFDLVPHAPAPPQKLFLLVDGREFGMTLEWYVYLAGEKIARMIIFFAFFWVTRLWIVNVFFWIEVADLLDFMIIANKPWFEILGFGVDFNALKLCIILIAFVVLWIRLR